MQLTKLLARLGLAAFALSTLNLQLSTALAQGTAFTYQGVLSQGGAAINGSNDLTFTLYNAVSGGATVGTSNVVNDLVMSNGLFTVTLDFGAGAFDGSARWLQIAARPGASTGAYTNLAPRTSITPMPYAIYAGGANAANLVGTVADARLSANVGLRTGGNAFSGNQIITGGNVGIGTATPNNLLDVAASGVIGNSTVLGLNIHDTLNRGTKVSFGYNVPGSEFNGMRAVVNPGTALCGNSGDLLFYTWECNTSGSREVMRINGSGNVGIGTVSPSEKLDVAGNILASGTVSAGGNLSAGSDLAVGGYMRVSGNLGIGENDPGFPLNFGNVLGDKIALFGNVAGQPNFGFGIQSSLLQIHTADAGSDVSFGYGTSAAMTETMRIKGNGNVGIRTTNPITSIGYPGSGWDGLHTRGPSDNGLQIIQGVNSARLHLRADNNITNVAQDFIIANGANRIDFIWLGSGLANRLLAMTIATNGNVGIAGEVTTTAVNITSDRNAKEQFKPVNAREVLAKVVGLPISEWQYKTQSDARHIGPMAQDFREAFSLGRDEKHITSVDADGVALAAIQGMNEKLEEKTQEVDALKKSVAALTELVNKLAAQQNGGGR